MTDPSVRHPVPAEHVCHGAPADAPTEPASDLEVRPDAPSSAVPADEARDRLAALRDDLRAVALAPGNHWTHCPVRDGGQCSCEGTLREVNDRAKARWEMADAALAGYAAQAERADKAEADLAALRDALTALVAGWGSTRDGVLSPGLRKAVQDLSASMSPEQGHIVGGLVTDVDPRGPRFLAAGSDTASTGPGHSGQLVPGL